MAPFPRQLGCSLLDTPRADSVGHLHCLAPSPSSLSQGCDGEGSSNGNGGGGEAESFLHCGLPVSSVSVCDSAGHGHPRPRPRLHWAWPSRTVAPPSLGTAIQDRGPSFTGHSHPGPWPRLQPSVYPVPAAQGSYWGQGLHLEGSAHSRASHSFWSDGGGDSQGHDHRFHTVVCPSRDAPPSLFCPQCCQEQGGSRASLDSECSMRGASQARTVPTFMKRTSPTAQNAARNPPLPAGPSAPGFFPSVR